MFLSYLVVHVASPGFCFLNIREIQDRSFRVADLEMFGGHAICLPVMRHRMRLCIFRFDEDSLLEVRVMRPLPSFESRVLKIPGAVPLID